jgi:MFS family permease
VTRVGLAFHRTFHAVSHSRNFRLFFVGQAISVTGTWVQSVASAWLVLQLTNASGVALGIQAALNFGPILFIGPFAGLLADRRNKRSILIGTQTAFGVLAIALWALVATDVVTLWMVYALSFLQGVVTAVDNPARQSFYAEMVGPDELTNAVSLNSAIMTGTRIVGPALAGLLIAAVGLAACFLLNGLSYIAVIGGLLLMRQHELRRTVAGRRKGQLREGFEYAWRTRELRDPLIWMAVVFMLSFNFSILFPLMAKRVFSGGPGLLGTLLSVMGIGSLIGALLMARQREPNARRLALAAIAFGGTSFLVAIAPTLTSELLLLVPMGFVSMVFMITGNSTLQLTSRPDMRGRVMSLYGVVFLGGTPIGAPIAGAIAAHWGPRAGLVLGAVAAVATGLVGLAMLSAEDGWVRRRIRRGRGEVVGVPAGAGRIAPQLSTDDAVTG